MQENLKKYMGNYENPKGTNIINNLTMKKPFQSLILLLLTQATQFYLNQNIPAQPYLINQN